MFKQFLFSLLLFGLCSISFSLESAAEPWISNRYAQNCAACHAPGRYNLKPKERRCTLSCQGCHVNPTGGGIRNQYGIWNQQRWLRSFYSKKLRNKRTPAPLHYQPYRDPKFNRKPAQAKKPSKGKKKAVKNAKKGKGKVTKKQARLKPKATKGGAQKFAVTTSLSPRFEDYDRIGYPEYKVMVSKEKYASSIPSDDPYRLERKEWIYAGGDIRYMYGKQNAKATQSSTTTETDVDLSFLMAVDFGFRFRPIEENLSFVAEARFSNGPAFTDPEFGVTQSSQIRSAYVIVDDLMYNTFAQLGLFRPQFGHYNPDHTNLISDLTGFDQDTIFKAAGFGGSPNVPFFSVYAIQPLRDSVLTQRFAEGKSEGFVLNAGARAVTLGLSGMVSYWSSAIDQSPTFTEKLKKDMLSVSGGVVLFKDRFIVNGEFIRIDEEFEPGKKNGGNVYSFETKYRLWRENYIQANYAFANVARNPRLNKGESTEMSAGVKMFLLSGMELDLVYALKEWTYNDPAGDQENEDTRIQAQLHLFW